MTELYFFSFVFLLIAGMLSHDRSVTNPPVEWVKEWTYVQDYRFTSSQNEDFTATTFTATSTRS